MDRSPSPSAAGTVKRPVLIAAIAAFFLSFLLSMPVNFLYSWSEAQIADKLGITQTTFSGKTLAINQRDVFDLTATQYSHLIFLRPTPWLDAGQRRIIDERYEQAFAQFPASLYRSIRQSVPMTWGAVGYLAFGMLLCVPLFVIQMMLLYRSWKSLEPLKRTDPLYAANMPSPLQSVILLFIPLFHVYWIYVAFGRLCDKARFFAERFQRPYRGPSPLLVAVFIGLFYWDLACFLINMAPFGAAWYLNNALSLASLYVYPAMAIKLWRMIRDFSTVTLPAVGEP